MFYVFYRFVGLCFFVKAHTKLPILAAYPYLTAIFLYPAERYGYAASIGSLVCTGCFKKVAPLKFIGIFSRTAGLCKGNSTQLLVHHILKYLPILVDLSQSEW